MRISRLRNKRSQLFSAFLFGAALACGLHAQQLVGPSVQFCGGASPCAGKDPKIANFTMLQQGGGRPRFSPNGQTIVFDRLTATAYTELYTMDYFGNNVQSITANNPGITQRNNGNGIFDQTGNYIFFLSEVPNHVQNIATAGQSDPGIGMFSNLWATTVTGSQFWQLTNIPISTTNTDGIPYYAVVNPILSLDGSQLTYDLRYGGGGPELFGDWRLMTMPISTANGTVTAGAQSVLFQPTTGNYVTGMGFWDPTHMEVAGNLSGQTEFGMDQYVLNTTNGSLTDLTNTPTIWEEGSCISPNKQWVVYMSNQTSNFQYNTGNTDWEAQPMQREYWLMDKNGNNKERLTYFNDSTAPEYLGGNNIIVAACGWSPDGRSIVGTLGVEFPNSTGFATQLKIVRMDFQSSLLSQFAPTGTPLMYSGIPVVSSASFAPSLVSAGWMTIFGENLAPDSRGWQGSDFVGNALPTSLDGVSVSIDGKPAYVQFISPGQINVLAPDDSATGQVSVTVTTPAGTSPSILVNKQLAAPGFFTYPSSGYKYIIATHANNTLIGPTSFLPGLSTPAQPGETIVLYGTGFGPTSPATPTGQLVSGAPTLANKVTALVGNIPATVTFAGLVASGLNQINVTIPANAPAGDLPVVVTVAGVQSQANAFITVQ